MYVYEWVAGQRWSQGQQRKRNCASNVENLPSLSSSSSSSGRRDRHSRRIRCGPRHRSFQMSVCGRNANS